jgi:hypothetical protein
MEATAMQPAELFKTFNGKRVGDVHCYCCGGQTAVLRQRWCKDELELFCDRCETWAGRRITVADVEAWIEQSEHRHGAMNRRLIIAACLAA